MTVKRFSEKTTNRTSKWAEKGFRVALSQTQTSLDKMHWIDRMQSQPEMLIQSFVLFVPFVVELGSASFHPVNLVNPVKNSWFDAVQLRLVAPGQA
jgi:hypothetical protein